MKRYLVRRSAHALLALTLATVLGGCEEIVYRDRPIFAEPPAAAGNFVGYSDTQQKLTVCGNCHTSVQRQWLETAHASAWQRLQGLGAAAQASFGQQHTTNETGNLTTTAGGWSAVRDVRYQDVQCESCHGPGLDHVRAPTRQNWPLAPLSVGVNQPQGCGECHSTSLDPYHQEWARSAHALIPNAGSTATSPAGRDACWGCHTGEDALILWGVKSEFLEKRTHVANAAQNVAISCGVCHDPHRAEFDAEGNRARGQLRHPIDVPSEEDNLCMKCHHKRGTPDLTTFRGPHSPEGPTLLGFAGAWLPGMTFPAGISATHGSERNPRLCAGCHVGRFEATDPVTGQPVLSTGHTFEATPCVGGNGLPVDGPCADEQKTYRTCTGAGCHANEQTARGLENLAASRVTDLTNELSALLQIAHRRGGRTDNWWQCRGSGNCPGSPLHWATNQNQTWTVALSSAWNFELVRSNAGGGGALRMGQVTHNPILIETLLRASIREMRREYNIPAQSPVSLEQTFGLR